MARETSYFVQSFNAGKGGNLKSDAPVAVLQAIGASDFRFPPLPALNDCTK